MERIDREIERTLGQTGGGAGLALTQITAIWPSVVGAAIARNAWPLRIGRDRTLHVATSSATWAFELDRMSEEIAERLAGALGDDAPRSLRFRVGPVPECGPALDESVAEAREPVPETPPEVVAAADAIAAGIEDPDLRELVARAARASLR
jgi:hypothetical protein